MIVQVGREVLAWTPEPQQCCRNCQVMLEAVENKCLDHFDARFRASIGRVTDCKPLVTVTPPGTHCSSPCLTDDGQSTVI